MRLCSSTHPSEVTYRPVGHRPILPIFGHAEEVPTRLEFNRCIKILKDWLQDCITHHDACSASQSTLPKRLIQISGESLRLVNTAGLAYSHYMTLSHCWGKTSNMMKTTKENIDIRLAGIPEKDLPQVFKDAIAVTRRVGCQWIWIDSLCIIQDDEADWKEQAARMADIYSNSYLNIAATLSGSSYGSCFADRSIHGDSKGRDGQYDMWTLESLPTIDYTQTSLRVRVAHSRGHGYVTDTLRKDRAHVDPLLNRAWVFQERLLAPRNLHFEASEMIWECNAGLACECTGLSSLPANQALHNEEMSQINPAEISGAPELPSTLKASFSRTCLGNASHQQETLTLWLRIIELYSTLALTNLFDRTYALAGLSSRISSQLSSTFLAGIFAADLPRSLLWSAWPRHNHSRPSETRQGRERLTPTFPTWSWMSQYEPKSSNSHVLFPENAEEFIPDPRLHVHYSDTFCEYESEGNPFGGIISGQLDITAAVLPAKLAASEEGMLAVRLADGNAGTLGEAWFDCPTADSVSENQDILCLYPGTLGGKDSLSGMEEEAYVLVLRRVSGERERYMRIGILFLNAEELSGFRDAEVRRVRIV